MTKLRTRKEIRFTEEQKKVIDHEKGPAMVLAVPGSGKTTTLLARTARLVVEKGVDPERIMTVTFSRESAKDLRNRFESVFDLEEHEKLKEVKFSTIHSMAYWIIREEYSNMDVDGSSVFIDFLTKEGLKLEEEYILGIERLFDFLTDKGLSTKQLNEDELKMYLKFNCANITQLLDKYEKYKSNNNYISFNDQLRYCLDILKDDSRRPKYQAKYDFIQVDEFQDVSKIQYDIIKLLAGANGNLLCIGDIDQSIMSFRGVDINALLDFTKDFKKAELFNMSTNFRSAPEIVEIASGIISKNKKRVETSMEAEKDIAGKVDIMSIEGMAEIAEYITAKLSDIEGTSAVLFRNKEESVVLMSELIRQSIPFYYKEDYLKILELEIVNAIMSLLKLSINPKDYKSYIAVRGATGNQIVPYDWDEGPDEKKEDTSIPKRILEWDLEMLVYGGIKVYDKDIEFFQKALELKRLPGNKIMDYIFDRMGFGKPFRFNISSGRKNKVRRKLKAITRDCKDAAEIVDRIERLKESIKETPYNEDKTSITLSTIHSSKGLEWDNVFIIGERGYLYDENRSYSNISDYVEEERRLFYVAITRARKNLEIVGENCYSKELNEAKIEISKHIDDKANDINSEEAVIEPINIGDKLIHAKYGECTIVDIELENERFQAEFVDGIKRKFALYTLNNKIMKRIA